jgi:hypothetical protein
MAVRDPQAYAWMGFFIFNGIAMWSGTAMAKVIFLNTTGVYLSANIML